MVWLCAASGTALAMIMLTAWAVQQSRNNSGHVDYTWALAVGLVAFAAALLPFSGVWWRQIAVALPALVWGMRLGAHILLRNTHDDPRYRKLTEAWGEKAPRRMFRFLQGQAAVGVVLVVAVALAAHNPEPSLRLADAAGAFLLMLGIGGEALADRQLRRCGDRVCQSGLWRWSRHPNYFFEWLTWCAYPVIAVGTAYGWLALAAPAVMYWALVHASGIPPLEEHMLATRGDAYRAYQRSTSAFFPWPKRPPATGL